MIGFRAWRVVDCRLCRVRKVCRSSCWINAPLAEQAGASARIENYLGFPTGITGMALAGRAFVQAQKFGSEIMIPVCIKTLDCARKDGVFAT